MYSYPLTLSFKIISFAPQVTVTDSGGNLVAYVKQKALKLKEDVGIFADEDRKQPLYRIKADRALDWSANYGITRPDGSPVGTVRREGARSLWKATYRIADASGNEVGTVHEESAWVKMADALAGQIPGVSLFSGYFLNPAYLVDMRGSTALRVQKRAAFFEGRFTVEERGELSQEDEELLLPSLIMVVLLERERG